MQSYSYSYKHSVKYNIQQNMKWHLENENSLIKQRNEGILSTFRSFSHEKCYLCGVNQN